MTEETTEQRAHRFDLSQNPASINTVKFNRIQEQLSVILEKLDSIESELKKRKKTKQSEVV